MIQQAKDVATVGVTFEQLIASCEYKMQVQADIIREQQEMIAAQKDYIRRLTNTIERYKIAAMQGGEG